MCALVNVTTIEIKIILRFRLNLFCITIVYVKYRIVINSVSQQTFIF